MTVVSFEVASCACTPEQLSKVHADSHGGCRSRESVTDIEIRMVQLEEKLKKMLRHELQAEAMKHKMAGNLTGAQMISKLVSIERESAWLGLINAVRSPTGVEKSRLVLKVMEGNLTPQTIFLTIEENDSTGPIDLHLIHRIVDSVSHCDLGIRPDLFAIFTSAQVPETILASMKTHLPEVVNPTHPHAAIGWRIHCGVEVTELSTNKQHTLSALQVGAKGLEIIKKREEQKRQEENMNAGQINCIVNLGDMCVHCYLGCLIVGYCMVIVYIAEACAAPQRLVSVTRRTTCFFPFMYSLLLGSDNS
jgi:hypothetical protein